MKVAAIGLGATPGEAVSEALKMALLQVNGAVMQSSTVSVKCGLDIALDKDSVSLRASEFAEAVKQRSGGVITSLKVLELQEPSLITGKRYKASIEAEVAKFKPSADMQKLKVVVGPVRFERASLPMGDRSIPSAEVAAIVRQRISDALVQTGRFAVLDREFSPEIAQELELISSGQAPSAELAKMSQAASADLVWSARVSDLAYNRHVRQLKTSDRELVSYSGGWALSQKLVNVATRQVVTSDSLQGSAFQSVQAIDALLADFPALTLEHDQHAQVTESGTVHRNLPDAQAQRTLIACLALCVPHRWSQQRQPA